MSVKVRTHRWHRRLVFGLLVLGLAIGALASWAADAPAEKPIEGAWQGSLKTGALELRIVFHFAKDKQGKLAASMDSPDQGAKGLAIDAVTREGATIRLDARRIGASYEGKLDANGRAIKGQWKQSGQVFALDVARLDKAPDYRRPQDPQKPYPYRDEQVTYQNTAAGVKLAGTLTLPKSDRPAPAVLLLSGSGAQDRDESILGHRPFLVLADYLTRHGIAVLRSDDRGVGGSTGDSGAATTDDLAGDALAGVAYLKSRKEIDPRQIGLVGHSEGGMIAPLAAGRSADVAYIVLMAGTGVPGDQIVLHQGQRIARAQKADEKRIASARDLQEKIFAIIKSQPDAQSAERKITEALSESDAYATAPTPEAREAVRSQVEAQTKVMLTPWFRYFISYDPRPALTKVRCPVLAICGEKDLQVDPKQNLPPISAALAEAGNSDVTVVELPGLNHLFQHCQTGSPAEYGKIDETFASEALSLVAQWIAQRTR
jgi:pimeloyl-ACP methyl ester carboxylesterase